MNNSCAIFQTNLKTLQAQLELTAPLVEDFTHSPDEKKKQKITEELQKVETLRREFFVEYEEKVHEVIERWYHKWTELLPENRFNFFVEEETGGVVIASGLKQNFSDDLEKFPFANYFPNLIVSVGGRVEISLTHDLKSVEYIGGSLIQHRSCSADLLTEVGDGLFLLYFGKASFPKLRKIGGYLSSLATSRIFLPVLEECRGLEIAGLNDDILFRDAFPLLVRITGNGEKIFVKNEKRKQEIESLIKKGEIQFSGIIEVKYK